MLRYGLISNIDEPAGRARVYFKEDNLTTDWLPYLVMTAQDTSVSIPMSINEQVAVLCDEHLEDSVILGAVVSDVDKPGAFGSKTKWGIKFSDGAIITYDTVGSKWTISSPVEIDLTAPVIKLTGAITVTGALVVSGAITASGGLSGPSGSPLAIVGGIAASGDISASGVSLKTHEHGGVTTGSGITSIPLPPI